MKDQEHFILTIGKAQVAITPNDVTEVKKRKRLTKIWKQNQKKQSKQRKVVAKVISGCKRKWKKQLTEKKNLNYQKLQICWK